MSVPVDLSHFFHRSGGSSTQYHRDIEVPRGCCGGKLSLGVEDTLNPNRGQYYRSLELMAEDRCLGPNLCHSKRYMEEDRSIPPSYGQCSFEAYGG